ncbi:hypothetical protein [Blastococcus sp. Marseille-P5729]|uniref:hypothetical protein n=1 Tax=Blastococcus sp. Marseille-P5729 TaxID=2086582 RepID=UPI00131E23C3|nr:hypothetical protein [Blastococcus sp. Marseille-P5729]
MSKAMWLMLRLTALLVRPLNGRRDRGDVPGWVMVVVMTAALVIAILIPFREAIVEAIQNALNSVTGQ